MIVRLRLHWEQLGIEVVKLKCCGWARKGSFRLVVVIVNARIAELKVARLTACESSRGESDGHDCAVKIDCGERVLVATV
jgi:hypothetical protein